MDRQWFFSDQKKNSLIKKALSGAAVIIAALGVIFGLKTGSHIFIWGGIVFGIFDLFFALTYINLEYIVLGSTHLTVNNLATPLSQLRVIEVRNKSVTIKSAASVMVYHHEGKDSDLSSIDDLTQILPEICDVTIEYKRK